MTRMHLLLNVMLAVAVSCWSCKPADIIDDNTQEEVPGQKPDVPGDGIIRVLAIGNSFSADAVEQELWPLFNAVGQKVIIAQLYIGGCDLEKHWKTASGNLPDYSYRKIVEGEQTIKKNSTFLDGLKDEKWDYISFQQGGGHHGQYETFEPWLTQIINYCKENAISKQFKVVYHVPWVAPANSTNAKFGFYDYNTKKMYDGITTSTQKADAVHHFDLIINSVDAIENGRTSYLGDTFDRDGWHLNKTYGRYTAACIWFEKIMGQSVAGNPYHPDSITDYVAEICQTAAHEACLHPYQVTDLSRYTGLQ